MGTKSSLAGVAAAMLLCASGTAAFVINEFDSDTQNTPSTDYAEFIELKGNPGESATVLALVWFNGGTAGAAGVSYRAYDLDGLNADLNGYLLLGTAAIDAITSCDIVFNGNTLQNGEDAIALYTGDATSFPSGTQPTSTGLIDFVVYETGADVDADWSGFGSPITVINEAMYGSGANDSICRMPDGGSWDVGIPSPRAANNQEASYTATAAMNFLRFNQTTAQQATTRTFTIRNNGQAPIDVTTIALDPSTSSVFSIASGPTPALPATLAYNESITLVVQFLETDVTTNKVYGGSINYVVDALAPTGALELPAELVLATQTGSAGDLKVNEICYAPSSNDYNNDGASVNQDDEFVELYNTTASPILIEGWEIRITQAPSEGTTAHSFIFPVGATIPANGYVVMFSQGTPTGFPAGTAFARSTNQACIFNPGSFVEVNDAFTLIDGVAYLLAEDTPDADGYMNMGVSLTGGSIGRRPDGANFFRAFDPADVPGSQPSPDATNNSPTAARDWSLLE